MTIAVFAYLPTAGKGAAASRLQNLLTTLAMARPQSAIMLFTNVLVAETTLPQNVTLRYEQPLPLGRQWRLYQWHRKAAAAGAAVVLCFGAQSFVQTKSFTLLFLPQNAVHGRQQKAAVQKADKLLVTLKSEQEEVTKRSGRSAADIIVLPPTVPHLPAAQAAEAVKNSISEGFEYFLYYGPLTHHPFVIELLKAFSRFKRRQKSSWRLVLMDEKSQPGAALLQALRNYKYRNEVVLLSSDAAVDKASVVAAAYAFVYPQPPVHYGYYLLAALAAGLPIIATAESKEWLQDAAFYVNTQSDEALAAALMQVYKDEALHQKLSAASAARSQAFLPQRAVAAWNEALPEAAN